MPIQNRHVRIRRGTGGDYDRVIQVLPPDIANVIAAGEVVERPASVVRELIDNALDAEATSIEIQLSDAGKTLIEVIDNGTGMNEDDAQLALERHATSKVRTLDDLQSIHSLGFRGEALPSIAAAARVTITTARRDESVGTRIISEQRGTQVSVQKIGRAQGTSVSVEGLFAELPARQKFLKGDRTELSHIQDLVLRHALANPQCRFVLRHGKRQLLQCQPQQDLRSRVIELFGADHTEQLHAIEESGAARIFGFCGAPSTAKPGSSQLYLYVNGRAVRDRVLTHAVLEAYRTYIPRGEQPLAILFLDMDPSEVDVNVHPAKAEVRFVNSGAIHEFVKHAVRKVLEQNNQLSEVASHSSSHTYSTSPAHSNQYVSKATWRQSAYPQPTAQKTLQVQESMSLYESSPTPRWRALGQLAETYLLYEGPEGELCVVDQHAAHERLGYERFKREWLADGVEQQELIAPEIVQLNAAEVEAITQHHDKLLQLGFRIEDFGEGSVAVHAVPAILRKVDLAKLVVAVAADLAELRGTRAIEERIDHILMTMACHRMIRAGDHLNAEEAEALLAEMAAGESADRCPHGRPTWKVISKNEVERWFKRS